MNISIIICTFNRAHNLADCLSCIENQNFPDNLIWEVIIVDNNSKDSTRLVIEDYQRSSKLNIRYLFESEQGLSFARNAGLKASNGDYIIFIDDDIRVTKNWLNSIYESFKKHDCDAVGGRIHIDSKKHLPNWITSEMLGFLGHQDFGDIPHAMDGVNESPFGGNMAINRRVIERIGYFNTNLGRKGEGFKKDELFKGEETEYFSRLAAAGGTFYYHPDAIVYHKILPHQLTKRFFLDLHHNAGIQQSADDHLIHRRQINGVPLFVLAQLFRAVLRYMKLLAMTGFSESFRQLMNVYYFSGMIIGYRKKFIENQQTDEL